MRTQLNGSSSWRTLFTASATGTASSGSSLASTSPSPPASAPNSATRAVLSSWRAASNVAMEISCAVSSPSITTVFFIFSMHASSVRSSRSCADISSIWSQFNAACTVGFSALALPRCTCLHFSPAQWMNMKWLRRNWPVPKPMRTSAKATSSSGRKSRISGTLPPPASMSVSAGVTMIQFSPPLGLRTMARTSLNWSSARSPSAVLPPPSLALPPWMPPFRRTGDFIFSASSAALI
mmetsp:Transcript_1741/g.4919  ORF Transcript_1741/g.4919 Transcript_1741/m.4919 type:complete len:237 (-) Transcript_1741:545-1255(-)